MVEDNQFQIEQRQKKEKEGGGEGGGVMRRVTEKGKETDWTGEQRREGMDGGWLS